MSGGGRGGLRIGWVSPLPPGTSGIADYCAELLPVLARTSPGLELELYGDGPASTDWPGGEGFELHPLEHLPRRAGRLDGVLYHLGNDARHHGATWRWLREVPGVVVLHEFMLHHLVQELTLVRNDLEGYVEEHRYCYGADVARRVRARVEAGMPVDRWSHPLFERVVDSSLALLVHNRTTRDRVLASRPEARITVVPHHVSLAGLPEPGSLDVAEVRRRLGVPADAFLVASFGHITPSKRLEVSLRAFSRLHRRAPEAVYVVVGEVSSHYDLDRLVPAGLRRPDGGPAVVTTGRVPLADMLAAMVACDVAVNLRHPTGGETSGTLMRLLGLGRPVIVSDTGSFREIPDGCCAKVPLDTSEEEVLAALLLALAEDPGLRTAQGDNARRHMARHHTLEGSAAGYRSFLEEVFAGARPPEPLLPAPPPPLAPWPPEDVLTELAARVGALAADLGVRAQRDRNLLTGVAAALVDLGLDRPDEVERGSLRDADPAADSGPASVRGRGA